MAEMLVGVVMGSKSDWDTMAHTVTTLEALKIPCEVRVISAHRTPDLAADWAGTAEERGLEVIIAAAGGAAHLAGVLASKTTLPVLGVPLKGQSLDGLDSTVHGPDAPRRARRHARHRQGRRGERCSARRSDLGARAR